MRMQLKIQMNLRLCRLKSWSLVFIDCDGFRLIQSLAWLSVACLNREDDIDSLRFSIPFTWLGIKPTDLITISNRGCTLNVNDSMVDLFAENLQSLIFFSAQSL